MWLKVIVNEWSKREEQTGLEGRQTSSWFAEPESVCVCVQRGWGAWALLVTRASFIMSDEINQKADNTEWRNRYEPDLSSVIRIEQ